MSGTNLTLDAKLDLRAADPLKENILTNRGQDLTLDAKEVTQLGALCLQVIRSAAKTWAQDGKTLTFSNASLECAEQLNLLGFNSETISKWEAA